MTADGLLQRVDAARRRMRRLLALEGAARLGAASLAALLLAIGVDAWVRLPPGMRMAGLAVGLWCAGRWGWQRIAAPLLRPIPLAEVAGGLDRGLPLLEGRLQTAVEQLERPGVGAEQLWRRVIAQAAERTAGTDLAAAISARPARRAAMALLAMAGLTAAVGGLWPSAVAIGAPRWIAPLGSSAWPRFVEIRPLTGDVAVATGESATLEMRVARGAARRLKAWIVLASPDGTERRELMTHGEDDRYAYTLGRATGEQSYWFEAGDDSTDDRPGRVRVVRRPRLEQAIAHFAPPAYAAALGEQTADLGDAGATVLAGSRARLTLVFDKPLGRSADGRDQVELTRDDGESLACAAVDERRTSWQSDFECDEAATLFLSATDAEGLPLTPSPRFRIDVRDDAPPRVEVVDPPPVAEVPPRAQVRLALRAEDDVDVTELRLRARTSEGVEILDRVIWSGSARRGGDAAADAARLQTEYAWGLAAHALTPGTQVEYQVEARDAFERGGRKHEPAASRLMRLRIISAEEFNERLREEYAALLRRLRAVQTDQQAALEQTGRLAEARGGAAEVRSAGERIAAAAAVQQSIASAAVGVAERLAALAQRSGGDADGARPSSASQGRVSQNGASQSGGSQNGASPGGAPAANDSAGAASKLSAEVRGVAAGPMARAEQALRAARSRAATADQSQSPAGDPRGDALNDAQAAQREASEALAGLLSKLEQWTSVDAVVRKTRDLLDRQEDLARRTETATGELAGRAAEQLTPAQRDQAERLAAEQAGLAEELQRMLAQVERLSEALRRRDRSTAAALQDAREAAQQDAPSERMSDAADAIRQNRGMRARQSQDAAAAGLRSMLSAMSERSRRELAELGKNAAAAAQQLDKLIRTQKELITRTRTTAKKADAVLALPGLSPRQRTLRRTTVKLAAELPEQLPDSEAVAEAVAAPLEQAGASMENAAARLDDADADAAGAAQAEALASLQRAADEINQVRDRADQAQAERDLDALRRELAAVRDAQLALAEQAAPIAQRARPGSRPGRADSVALARQARQQGGLADRMAKTAESDAAAEVFQFICTGIGELMRSAADHLRERQPGAAIEDQHLAAARLTQLLADLQEASPPRPSRYAQADSGGGGGGASGQAKKPKLVPPIAELKMLRMLQSELNERTRLAEAKSDAATAAGDHAEGGGKSPAEAVGKSAADAEGHTETDVDAVAGSAQSAREQQQLAIRDLGRRQTELRELSQRMLERARQKPGKDNAGATPRYPAGRAAGAFDPEAPADGASSSALPAPASQPQSPAAPQSAQAATSKPESQPRPAASQRSAGDEELARRLLAPAGGEQDPMVRAMMLMDDSAKLLSERTETGAPTQRAQAGVIAALDEAIDAAQREQSGGSAQRGAKGESRQAGKRAARRSTTAGSGAPRAAEAARGDQKNQTAHAATTGAASSAPSELRRGWGFLPPRDREAVAQGAAETYHARYRARIEAYYRSLAARAEARP